MSIAQRITYRTVTSSIKGLTRLICRVHAEELEKVPRKGPLLLVSNHVNFLDAPLIYTHLQPRPVVGIAKSESWDNPLLGALFDLWGTISLKRGEADRDAFSQILDRLSRGDIVAIAPEGTRSGDGVLQCGHPGVAAIAFHSKAPLLPLVFFGGETLSVNFRQMRRTEFYIRVGRVMRINPAVKKMNQSLRQMITEEIMGELARLLPERYRGYYSEQSKKEPLYLRIADEC
jgi:1-acyl-sn-glycerol-3-phosphate acyltransferase